eukprot:NODE_3108_length_2091_cov_5.776986.p1 GENE.NODE_3108_length_2091_cov_5.776986~~NODE_3108_length_2091_cov_5.776986.p1  ORF type:complete len:641 (-),score=140.75 NODE_3108_length_2091_cov_5.776986:168-1913(-)
MAPSMTFDWEAQANHSEEDEPNDSLQVDLPVPAQLGSRRSFLKEAIRKTVSLQRLQELLPEESLETFEVGAMAFKGADDGINTSQVGASEVWKEEQDVDVRNEEIGSEEVDDSPARKRQRRTPRVFFDVEDEEHHAAADAATAAAPAATAATEAAMAHRASLSLASRLADGAAFNAVAEADASTLGTEQGGRSPLARGFDDERDSTSMVVGGATLEQVTALGEATPERRVPARGGEGSICKAKTQVSLSAMFSRSKAAQGSATMQSGEGDVNNAPCDPFDLPTVAVLHQRCGTPPLQKATMLVGEVDPLGAADDDGAVTVPGVAQSQCMDAVMGHEGNGQVGQPGPARLRRALVGKLGVINGNDVKPAAGGADVSIVVERLVDGSDDDDNGQSDGESATTSSSAVEYDSAEEDETGADEGVEEEGKGRLKSEVLVDEEEGEAEKDHDYELPEAAVPPEVMARRAAAAIRRRGAENRGHERKLRFEMLDAAELQNTAERAVQFGKATMSATEQRRWKNVIGAEAVQHPASTDDVATTTAVKRRLVGTARDEGDGNLYSLVGSRPCGGPAPSFLSARRRQRHL